MQNPLSAMVYVGTFMIVVVSVIIASASALMAICQIFTDPKRVSGVDVAFATAGVILMVIAGTLNPCQPQHDLTIPVVLWGITYAPWSLCRGLLSD